MTPELKPLSSLDAVLEKIHAEQLFAALESIHQGGYVTRDVRPTNLMVSLDGKQAYITDFGFATKEGAQATYRGTMTTASNRVLEILADDRDALVSVTFADERESLVKVLPFFLLLLLLDSKLNCDLTVLVFLPDDKSDRSDQFWGCCIYV